MGDPKAYWELGVGRVIDPKMLKFNEIILNSTEPINGLIYTDFTAKIEKETTKMELFSDVIHKGTPSTGSCLQFLIFARYYDDNENLGIYITNMTSQVKKTIWSSNQKQTKQNWIKIKIDVKYEESFRFMFRISSNLSSTYIAISDISYEQKSCAQIGVTTLKPTTKLISTTTRVPKTSTVTKLTSLSSSPKTTTTITTTTTATTTTTTTTETGTATTTTVHETNKTESTSTSATIKDGLINTEKSPTKGN